MDFILGLCFLVYGLIATEWLVPKIFVRLGYFKSVDEIWAKRDQASWSFWGAAALGLKGEAMGKISHDYMVYGWGWPLAILGLSVAPLLFTIIGIVTLSLWGP